MTRSRQPRTCSHPIYAQTLTGVYQAVRYFSPCYFSCICMYSQEHQRVTHYHYTHYSQQCHNIASYTDLFSYPYSPGSDFPCIDNSLIYLNSTQIFQLLIVTCHRSSHDRHSSTPGSVNTQLHANLFTLSQLQCKLVTIAILKNELHIPNILLIK